ncbi:hypothetical protein TSUD_283720 [Trifolium subterraneum]|uniref:EamA domain-containing protein n=1 Tax=Trifolium subterraneum TaxID=3900 RepID=A0A2Z6NYP3_TRISU|nr:hypothetical protein TSUD_283720 [Trifolium subterraneum]
MTRRWSFYMDFLPVIVIIGNECIDMGLLTLFKAATLQGMNNHVFIAYAYAVGTSVLLPVTLFTRRTRVVPPLTFSIICKSVLLGAIGCASQILGYISINFSSPTLASAIANLVPAFTFMLAVTFRMEKLAAKRRSSNAKVIGSIVSIAGAFVLTFYKGPSIINSSSLHQPIGFLKSVDSSWALAGILLTIDYFLVSLWYILQVHILKEFPDELTLVLLYSITATIISTVVALLSVPNSSAWKIGLNLSLISIVSSGIFGKLIGNIVSAWAIHLKGAVYVTSFKPLQIVISVYLGVIFLGDSLNVGSIVGATIISIGLYGVLWGKATEEIEEDVGVNTLFKAATLQGMSKYVFVAYSYAFATIFFFPVYLFYRRSRVVPQLSFSILSKIALLGFIGGSAQILGYSGISYSSPTLSSTIGNLIPAFTFILAAICRMEKIAIKTRTTQAKVLGSIISISGAFIVTFYKGKSITNIAQNSSNGILTSVDINWVIGGLLLIVSNILITIWFIVQVEIMKEIQDELTSVFFHNLFAAIFALCVGLLAETNSSLWNIRLDISLISIVCTAIFGKFLGNVIYSWAIHLKGPVYVAMFKPLSIVIAVIMGLVFLGDTLHIGSIVGATIISIGLYAVLWGKASEEIEEDIVGVNTLFKAATLQGMSKYVFVAYSYTFATIFFFPVYFFYTRSRVVPQLSVSILSKIALLGFIGCSGQILGYAGISYSSPTLSSAIGNLIPAFTFILASICRMEKIAIKTRTTQAKVLGSIISISGAFIVTFYKGKSITNIVHNSSSFHLQHSNGILTSVDINSAIGGLLLIVSNILITIWVIVQAEIMKEIQDELTLVFFHNLFAAILALSVGFLAETNSSLWNIRLDISLVSIACTAIFGKFVCNAVYAWAIHLKGPVYVTMFKPLSIAIAVVMGMVFLGDTLHIGSIVGATIISIGLYAVLWGKASEETEEDIVGTLESPSTENSPLLQNYRTDQTFEKKIDRNV